MQQQIQACVRLIITLSIMLIAAETNADNLKSLLMPGPVIKAHEKYEQDCDQCHDTSSKAKQGKLCMQCHDHENILDDINNKTGFHGRLPDSVKTNCKHCHTEHEGRDAKVILLDPSTFDHSKTDFLLKGMHTKTSCTACHEAEKKYHEAPHDCYSCHKESDAHDGKQGKKCGDCHSADMWKQNAFDHDKKTDFPLKGAHKDTSCSSCHFNQKYKDTPDTCIGCHKIQDIHNGGYGEKCDRCHTPKKWNEIKFDHGKETDFRLLGQHQKAACTSCHTAEVLKKNKKEKKKLPTDCFGCHKHDDSHKGKNGEKCDDCHNSKSWSKHKFNHDKETDFPLRGKHKELSCSFCHKGKIEKDEMKADCIECHKKDDVHRGKQGEQCNNCHNEKGWHDKVLFDHDLADFPLIGMHVATQCEECHLTSVYGSTDDECNSCHAGDDVHKTRLGTDCETCHNPNSWENWLFDHDKATRFEIDGAHKEVGCYDCHRTNSKGKLKASRDCISCHRSRDIHNRLFGRQCGNCHSTKSFKDINIRR